MKKKPSLALAALVFVSACEPVVASRGAILDPDLMAQIKPGVTTREDVASKLGTPTTISTFDDKIWYYVGRETEQYSFFAPDVIKQQAVEIDFDDRGVVASAKNLDISQATDADPVDRKTPTYGQQYTIWRELLGDLSHPVPDLSNQTRNH